MINEKKIHIRKIKALIQKIEKLFKTYKKRLRKFPVNYQEQAQPCVPLSLKSTVLENKEFLRFTHSMFSLLRQKPIFVLYRKYKKNCSSIKL